MVSQSDAGKSRKAPRQAGALRLICAFLTAGVLDDGVFSRKAVTGRRHSPARTPGVALRTVARGLTRQLSALYSSKSKAAHARDQLREFSDDIAERMLVVPLDGEVRREIARAAKRISIITELAPWATPSMLSLSQRRR